MKILFSSETFLPRVGGVDRQAGELVRDLRDRGHALVVATCGSGPDVERLDHDGIPVYRFPFLSVTEGSIVGPSLAHLERLANLKRAFAPDLIHVDGYSRSAWFHNATRQAYRAPVLLSLHDAPSESLRGRATLLEGLLDDADRIVCSSEDVLRNAAAISPVARPRMLVLRPALKLPERLPSPLRFDPPRLLMIGRLVREKGLGWLLPALPRLFERHPEARLDLVGGGPLRKRLESLAAELGLGRHVRFLGDVAPDAYPELVDGATLVILPSKAEGFALVALEAALMCRPVVAVRAGRLPEVVVHEQTGLLADPAHPSSFIRAIEALLADPERAQRYGHAARARALEQFAWSDYVDAHERLYAVLGGDAGRASAAARSRRPA